MKSLKEKFGKFAISQQELQTAQGGLGPRPCGSPTPPPCHQHDIKCIEEYCGVPKH